MRFVLQVDVIVGHFYDSIIFYASLVRDMVAAGEDYRDSDRLLDLTNNYKFYSPINGMVLMDENGDRQNSFVMRNFDPGTGRFEVNTEKVTHFDWLQKKLIHTCMLQVQHCATHIFMDFLLSFFSYNRIISVFRPTDQKASCHWAFWHGPTEPLCRPIDHRAATWGGIRVASTVIMNHKLQIRGTQSNNQLELKLIFFRLHFVRLILCFLFPFAKEISPGTIGAGISVPLLAFLTLLVAVAWLVKR